MTRLIAIIASITLAAFLTVPAAAGASAQATPPASSTSISATVQMATSWLLEQQHESGGFPGFSGEPEVSVTIDALLALVAAQVSGVDTGNAIEEAVAYIESGDGALVYAQSGAGQAAKLVLGAVAWGGNPSDIAGADPLSLLQAALSPDTGFYGRGAFDHALVLLALGAAGTDVPAEAVAALETSQTPEGGWAFDGSPTEGAADSNTTALVVMALVAIGQGDSPLIGEGLGFLQTTLVDDAGATFQPTSGAIADANSTALVIQAIIAASDNPSGEGWGDLQAALAGFQNESGAFHYNAEDTSDNLFSTVQAIPAVAGLPLPITPAIDLDLTPDATPAAFSSGRSRARAA